MEITESLLVALHGYYAASTLGEQLGPEIQRDALSRMQEAAAQLAAGQG